MISISREMSREGSIASSPIEARSRDAGYQGGDRRSPGATIYPPQPTPAV